MSIFIDNPLQPILAMPTDLAHWHSRTAISDPAARWRIYLHHISLTAIMTWLQEEFEQPVLPWPHGAPFDMWYAVEGLCLQLGNCKLTVIPSETIAMEELEVPQEWVDLPIWHSDYYLAAHVNVDEQQLVLWGYTNRKQLKTQGTYSSDNRTYRLNADDMKRDFSAFWVAQQLVKSTPLSPESSTTVPLPQLSATEANTLIQQIIDRPDPRLALPFDQWGALFSNDIWRQQLYQTQHTMAPINIQDWLDQIYHQGWQPIENLLPTARLARLRSVATATTTAVLTCGKKIVLDNNYDDLLLMFSVDMEAQDRRNIRIQLYPSSEPVLPSQVGLALEIPQTGKILKSVTAGQRDSFIQIPPFRCTAGQLLRVNIQLENINHREDFIS